MRNWTIGWDNFAVTCQSTLLSNCVYTTSYSKSVIPKDNPIRKIDLCLEKPDDYTHGVAFSDLKSFVQNKDYEKDYEIEMLVKRSQKSPEAKNHGSLLLMCCSLAFGLRTLPPCFVHGVYTQELTAVLPYFSYKNRGKTSCLDFKIPYRTMYHEFFHKFLLFKYFSKQSAFLPTSS